MSTTFCIDCCDDAKDASRVRMPGLRGLWPGTPIIIGVGLFSVLLLAMWGRESDVSAPADWRNVSVPLFRLANILAGVSILLGGLFAWMALRARRHQSFMFKEGCVRTVDLLLKQRAVSLDAEWKKFLDSFALKPIALADGSTCLALVQVAGTGTLTVSCVWRQTKSATELARRLWPQEMRFQFPLDVFRLWISEVPEDWSSGLISCHITPHIRLRPGTQFPAQELSNVLTSGKADELAKILVQVEPKFWLEAGQLRTPPYSDLTGKDAAVSEPPQPDSLPASPDAAPPPSDPPPPPAEGVSTTPPDSALAGASAATIQSA